MSNTINCLEDIESNVAMLLNEVQIAQNPICSAKILDVRMSINERICELYKFAAEARDRFPLPGAYDNFCEDIEIISQTMRQHQLHWTTLAIERNQGGYLESSRQVEKVVRIWVKDMKSQLGPILMLAEMPG